MAASAIGKTGVAYARLWHQVDARGQILGNLARGVATTLTGLHKPVFSPSRDCGDYVVVTNAKEIVVSGNKAVQKLYRHHTGHPGGLKEIAFKDLLEKNPEKIIRRAVYGMLPKDKLRRQRINRLKVFANDQHPYSQNFATYREDPDLMELNAKDWANMSAEEMLQRHEQKQLKKLQELMETINVSAKDAQPPVSSPPKQ